MSLLEYAAAYRQEQLLREAEAERLAREARGAYAIGLGQRARSTWRIAVVAVDGFGRRAAAAIRRTACALAPGPVRGSQAFVVRCNCPEKVA